MFETKGDMRAHSFLWHGLAAVSYTHLDVYKRQAITLTLISSLIIMVIGPLLTKPLMALLKTPADIYDMSCTYLIIVFVGIAGMAYYNILSGLLRGLRCV